ncbi:unnamed protein product [Urochloa humidicola]
MRDLGVDLIMKPLRSSRFACPFDHLMFRHQPPDVDKAMKVRSIILSGVVYPKLQKTCTLMCVKEEFRCNQLDHCTALRSDIYDSFADAKHCRCLFIDYFAQCLSSDDRDERPNAAGYRVILPASLSGNILVEQFNCSVYSPKSSLFYLTKRFDRKEILHAKLIDILDSFQWPSEKKMKEYHGAIAGRIRTRLNDVLRRFTNCKFTDFSEWGFAFVPVPKQALEHDSGFFAMMFLEHYNGERRKMDIHVDPIFYKFRRKFNNRIEA